MYSYTLSALIVLAALSIQSTRAAAPFASSFLRYHAATTVDRCANLDKASLVASNEVSGKYHGTVSGCLCYHTITPFILFSRTAREAVRSVGHDATVLAVRDLVATDSTSRVCHYPINSLPACSPSDVCGFVCAEGYSLCDGECKPGNCHAAEPAVPSDKRCAKGYIACPVDTKDESAFICVDPLNDPEHCGGCASIKPPSGSTEPEGANCSTIRGALNPTCKAGSCAVDKCRSGWNVADDSRSCMRRYNLKPGQIRLGRRP